MNLDTVMTEVATRLDTIADLRVFDHPVDEVQPPTAIVSLPQISFDQTYGRGSDRYTMPVVLAVGRVSDRASRNNLAPYIAGSGAKSFKAVLEGFTPISFDTVRVQGVEFDVITWGTVEYLTATFLLDIMGSGA
jgi:hypothetical protein